MDGCEELKFAVICESPPHHRMLSTEATNAMYAKLAALPLFLTAPPASAAPPPPSTFAIPSYLHVPTMLFTGQRPVPY